MPVPGLPQASVYGEYEQSVQGDERKATSLGGEYKFSQLGRVYVRTETVSSNSNVGGVATDQKWKRTYNHAYANCMGW